MTKAPSKCGTYAGYNSHVYYGEEVCDPCREARRQYIAARRRNNPKAREYDRRTGRARARATWRLVDMHREMFDALVEDELRVEANRAAGITAG